MPERNYAEQHASFGVSGEGLLKVFDETARRQAKHGFAVNYSVSAKG
jgi:hypothetical protein